MSEVCSVYNVSGASLCWVGQGWTSAGVLITEASLYHHDASTKNAGPILAMWQFNSFSSPSFLPCIILNKTMPLLS